MEYKDYYQSLGLSKGASAEDIRSAFRKLARKYHPDVAGNEPKAEEKFKEINEAYEVLSDPEKRQKYDRLGSNWQQDGGFRPPPGWQGRGSGYRGFGGGAPDVDFDFGGTGFSDFFEQFFGAQGRSSFESSRRGSAHGIDVEADIMVTLEEVSHGSIRSISVRDRGNTAAVRHFKIKVPKGVAEGQKLRLTGKGEIGQGGTRAGDLYLRVRYARHPDFRVEIGNLYFDATIAPWDAVLGTKLQVPVIGGSVQIRIPSGSQPGQKLRIKSKGLPVGKNKVGDLYVGLKVVMPANITEDEKVMWERLRDRSSFHPGSNL